MMLNDVNCLNHVWQVMIHLVDIVVLQSYHRFEDCEEKWKVQQEKLVKVNIYGKSERHFIAGRSKITLRQ